MALHAPLVPFKPYIQGEVGGVSTNDGQNSSRTGNFAYQVQLGADFTIFPHLDLRGEYSAGNWSAWALIARPFNNSAEAR